MKYLGSNAAKYGKTFLFWPGNKAMLVCMDQDIVRQVLTDTKTFVKGDDYTMKFSVVFGEGLVTANGERHKHDRSCLGKYFLRSSIEKQLEMICTQTKKAMDEVLEAKHTHKQPCIQTRTHSSGKCNHPSLVVYSLGVYSLGIYNLGQRDLDPDNHY